MPPRPEEEQPALPPRSQETLPPYNPQDYAGQPAGNTQRFADAPPRVSPEKEDISSPIHFTRDPHKLVGYLVPFPKPQLHGVPSDRVPQRFLIYTPPPPPISSDWKEKHADQKESKIHKVQRKWQEELREAKMGNAKTASWKGVKGKVTKGISWGMSQTKTSSLEFLNRIGGEQEDDKHAEDGHVEEDQTKKTVKLEEMVLIYPASMPGEPQQIREEFVNTMLRSKSKAQRDAVIATGLLPVSFAIDVLATLIWPFGGLLEIDAVWLYSSIRGAKTSRNVTKRLTSSSQTNNHDEDKLALNFVPSPRLQVLERYLTAKCHEKDPKLFPGYQSSPSETEVLEAIGWTPTQKGGADRNWEDEQWEITEVKDDLKSTFGKGAKDWVKWTKEFEKKPEKALKH